MNEFEIIDQISKRNHQAGIGDDCSVVEFNDKDYLVTTTDLLVENIHFRLSTTSLKDLGYKTLAVNISDIAAMAAKPLWAHLSLALPSHMKQEQVEEFLQGFYELSDPYGIQLMGGDLSQSPSDLFINLTLSGRVAKEGIKRRSDFQVGDGLFVTGHLGESAAGLRLLEKEAPFNSLTQKHRRPDIHLKQAWLLGESSRVHGMMDLSDGLLSDLERAAESSSCGFDVALEELPLSRDLKDICEQKNWDPVELALAGGEDYCLLFSAESSFQLEGVFKIGEVTEKNIRFLQMGKEVELNLKAFSHFGSQ